MGLYLLASVMTFGLGFPLDDAWIHQTYARNFAQLREWSFIPGQPSGASTGPLWGLLLSLGYFLHFVPYVWSYLLGWLSLFGMSLVGVAVFPYLNHQRKHWALWAGILLILEWHLVWAGASGMETLVFALTATFVLTLLIKFEERLDLLQSNWVWLGMGSLIGLSIWFRPDGITLLGPAGLFLLLTSLTWRKKTSSVLFIGIGFLLLFIPYLFYNQYFTGDWWPNTYYAKQAEYIFLRQTPLLQRWLDQAILPLIGVGALLFPGLVVAVRSAIRKQRWSIIVSVLWLLGYLLMYAWRLPVTYQHGRYVIPMMPIFFILSFSGMADFVQPGDTKLVKRVLSKAWLATAGIILAAFWLIGARAYARDVAFIESEMVTIAHWINSNTSSDAVIATHDIGAIGYFTDRQIIDLAGLISPEVIPYLWDDENLGDYMTNQNVDYLVSFPGWYPILTDRATLIYQTDSPYSIDMGSENMAVYDWRFP